MVGGSWSGTCAVVAPVHRPRLIDEIEQGLIEKVENLLARPIVAGLRRIIALPRSLSLACFAADTIHDF